MSKETPPPDLRRAVTRFAKRLRARHSIDRRTAHPPAARFTYPAPQARQKAPRRVLSAVTMRAEKIAWPEIYKAVIDGYSALHHEQIGIEGHARLIVGRAEGKVIEPYRSPIRRFKGDFHVEFSGRRSPAAPAPGLCCCRSANRIHPDPSRGISQSPCPRLRNCCRRLVTRGWECNRSAGTARRRRR